MAEFLVCTIEWVRKHGKKRKEKDIFAFAEMNYRVNVKGKVIV